MSSKKAAKTQRKQQKTKKHEARFPGDVIDEEIAEQDIDASLKMLHHMRINECIRQHLGLSRSDPLPAHCAVCGDTEKQGPLKQLRGITLCEFCYKCQGGGQ